jgi:hypothetical protein
VASTKDETHFQDTDPACYETVHNGRDVHVCICSGDKCNGASGLDTGRGLFGLLGLGILVLRNLLL